MIASECVPYQHLIHIHTRDPPSHFFLLCFITSAIDSITRCDKKGVTLGGGQALAYQVAVKSPAFRLCFPRTI